jgi:hypothetical protein
MERTTLGTSRLLGRAGTLPPGGGGGGGGGPPNPGIGGGGGGGGGGPGMVFVEKVRQIFSCLGWIEAVALERAGKGGGSVKFSETYKVSPRAHERCSYIGYEFQLQILIKKNRNRWRLARQEAWASFKFGLRSGPSSFFAANPPLPYQI